MTGGRPNFRENNDLYAVVMCMNYIVHVKLAFLEMFFFQYSQIHKIYLDKNLPFSNWGKRDWDLTS